MRVRAVLIAVLVLVLHGSAAAQGSKLVQVFVKVGGAKSFNSSLKKRANSQWAFSQAR
jgi:23S rRNA pseudoU1915 N3-methylase RlmH